MGERKVLNKYFPPDFDPTNVPRREKPKDNQITVRVMLPFTCRCKTCGEYIHRGKKFNSRCEWAEEKYLDITIMRFYVKCPMCCAEITFKTDPKNSDYTMEHGAIRNHEPWREDDFRLKQLRDRNAEFDKNDVMKQLEDRTIESKRELDIIDALEEIQELNNKNATKSAEEMIGSIKKTAFQKEEDDIAEELQQVEFKRGRVEKRLSSDEEDEDVTRMSLFGSAASALQQQDQPSNSSILGAEEAESLLSASLGPVMAVRVLSKKKKKKKKKRKESEKGRDLPEEGQKQTKPDDNEKISKKARQDTVD